MPWIPDSRQWIPDSLSVELRFWIPIVTGFRIPWAVFRIPKPKIPDSGILVPLHGVSFDSESNNIQQSSFFQSVSSKYESTSNFRRTSKRVCFKIAASNVNSLSAYIDEIRILLDDKFLDVLAVQERKLHNCEQRFRILHSWFCFN